MLKTLGRGFSTSAVARAAIADTDVCIVSLARTPIASFHGALASVTAPELGAHVAKAAVERAGVEGVEECYFGNVLSANLGQAPARQVVLRAGFSDSIPSTTVHKVCASGMKATMLGASSITLGHNDVVLVGGMESMSNAPFYLDKMRGGQRLGHVQTLDSLIRDGLSDAYDGSHMGNCGEVCSKQFNISRADQDAYAVESYRRATQAIADGKFVDEIAPFTVSSRKGDVVVDTDEEPARTQPERIPTLRAAFQKDGTVTAANASSINDGACAMVLASGKKVKELGLTPLARIRGYGDAAMKPVDFTIAPSKAIPIAIERSGLQQKDIDFYEINEAFSVVALANMQLMNIDHSKINVNGGAVALGHPIGASGARIIGTLVNVLKQNDATFGAAAICNGGGGSSAIVVERLN